jgi:hypothetical protein
MSRIVNIDIAFSSKERVSMILVVKHASGELCHVTWKNGYFIVFEIKYILRKYADV